MGASFSGKRNGAKGSCSNWEPDWVKNVVDLPKIDGSFEVKKKARIQGKPSSTWKSLLTSKLSERGFRILSIVVESPAGLLP
jgi:hypothetical protein